jgi:hypothetical protein
MAACRRLVTPPERIAASTAKFSSRAFREGLTRVIAATRERRNLGISASLAVGAL